MTDRDRYTEGWAAAMAQAVTLVRQRLDVYARERKLGTESGVMLSLIVERLESLRPDNSESLAQRDARVRLDEARNHPVTSEGQMARIRALESALRAAEGGE